jgi:hypothetical protein
MSETNVETTAAGIGEDTGTSRTGQAKQLLDQAGQTLKTEAQSFASAAGERARAEAHKHTETATRTLGDFANAVRRAGDELAASDQSPASRLVRQAADGLESLSRNLADKEPEDLLNAVRDFGRKNPVAFIGGSVLLGLALGRFVRASESGGRPPRLRSDEMTFAEEDAYDGPSETIGAPPVGAEAGIDQPIESDLGDLSATPESETTTSVGVGDATSGIGEPGSGGSTSGTGR